MRDHAPRMMGYFGGDRDYLTWLAGPNRTGLTFRRDTSWEKSGTSEWISKCLRHRGNSTTSRLYRRSSTVVRNQLLSTFKASGLRFSGRRKWTTIRSERLSASYVCRANDLGWSTKTKPSQRHRSTPRLTTEPEPQQALPFGQVSDAPLCSECGGLMTRNGSCYKCENCGGTSGCS